MTTREFYKDGRLIMWITDLNETFVLYCYNCGKENVAAAVATGECAWCGWVGNELDLRQAEDDGA